VCACGVCVVVVPLLLCESPRLLAWTRRRESKVVTGCVSCSAGLASPALHSYSAGAATCTEWLSWRPAPHSHTVLTAPLLSCYDPGRSAPFPVEGGRCVAQRLYPSEEPPPALCRRHCADALAGVRCPAVVPASAHRVRVLAKPCVLDHHMALTWALPPSHQVPCIPRLAGRSRDCRSACGARLAGAPRGCSTSST